MEFKGKKALVCGMAKSGISAAELLNKLGSKVVLQDLKKREELGDKYKPIAIPTITDTIHLFIIITPIAVSLAALKAIIHYMLKFLKEVSFFEYDAHCFLGFDEKLHDCLAKPDFFSHV